MADARASLKRVDAWVQRLTDHAASATTSEAHPLTTEDRFEAALDNDLNISGALGELFKTISECNLALDRNELTPAQARGVLDWWQRINRTLGLEPDADANAVPAEVQGLVDQRAQARTDKNWKLGDELRDKVLALGWAIKDSKDGQKLTRA